MHHSFAGPNSLCPAQMTVDARLSELGRILAAGVLRMTEKSSSISTDRGDSSLAMAVDLRTEGLGSIIREMVSPKEELAA